MRINHEFARALAHRLHQNAMRLERGALDNKIKALGERVLVHIYGGREEQLEQLGEPWVRRAKNVSFNFRDGKNYADMNFTFDEERIMPAGSWNTTGVDLSDNPMLMAEVMEISDLWKNHHRRGNNLLSELEQNIKKARTVKKLLELWPEAAKDIAAVAERYFDGADVETPLAAIVGRHATMALAAPVEIIEASA